MIESDADILQEGRRVLEHEAEAVTALAPRLDTDFAKACRLVAEASGRVVLSGVGKSGHVARKIAATLSSTGTPASYLHTVEALHGDLGVVGSGDVAILISKSGSGAELVDLAGVLMRMKVPIVALTGTASSELGRVADLVLDCSVAREACPMDLTPSSSTTATLAMGDAIALVVLQLKGFGPADFGELHPGGALGRKLSVRVADVMISRGFPSLPENATMRDAIVPLAEQRGTVPIVTGDQKLVGIITAGDLTRLMEHDEAFLERGVAGVMTRDPKTASAGELGVAAVARMEQTGVMALPVVDEETRVIGMVHLHDLLRSGAV